MKNRSGLRLFLAAGVGSAVLCGCADKLTRENYDMILVNSSDKVDVEQILGEPTNKLDDRWHYERVDAHLNVFIHYDEMGIVSRKQWMGSSTGEWHDTYTPPSDRSEVETTTIETHE